MKTIIDILRIIGPLKRGFSITIENAGWMKLCIEDIQAQGPNGLPVISVAHYGEMNGDAMRDPEMLFELGIDAAGNPAMYPYYFLNDYAGVEQYSTSRQDGRTMVRPRMKAEHQSFARMWSKNLKDQGFFRLVQEAAEGKPENGNVTTEGMDGASAFESPRPPAPSDLRSLGVKS